MVFWCTENARLLRGLCLFVGLLAGTAGALAESGAPVGVSVQNGSQPVLCAEEDNVTLMFSSGAVRRFRIEATHPTYLATLQDDNWDADWTACDFGPEVETKSVGKEAAEAPQTVRQTERVTLYEEPEQWLVGWRFPTFWRAETATVTVGEKVTRGLHMIQLWRLRPNGGEEVLVFYPQDGYWRARPLAPKGRDLTAFGSSFIVGPVETDERPLVRITDVTYLPREETFRLTFAQGGQATLKIAVLSARKIGLDVAFDRDIPGKPFAAMRSMYVTGINNDVAHVAARAPAQKGWREAGILDFKGGEVAELWAGRLTPSRHNTSAPDMTFKSFRTEK
jgi:hypothetical protein